MDFHSETLSQAQASIHKLQQNLINFLEKGVLTPINIKEFMNCYGLINGISGKIKGEDEEAAKIFCEFINEYIRRYWLDNKEKDGEYIQALVHKKERIL